MITFALLNIENAKTMNAHSLIIIDIIILLGQNQGSEFVVSE